MTDTDDDPGEVTVSLRPAEQSVPPGEETTLAVTVEAADSGISAYESAVHLDGGGRITRVELTGDPVVPVTELDDTMAVMAAAMGPDSDHDPDEEIVVAEITVTGDDGASLALTVDDETEVAPLGDGTERYTVGDCAGATLTVGEDD
ncbi:MAG: hypothetical protein J07HX64_01494 [halophilic archaeon J07HX64]|jgi:hypothetical protein|nr:MAG: hypothetical protein J07HX64_01494 [halophilic archaeon J07HX64]